MEKNREGMYELQETHSDVKRVVHVLNITCNYIYFTNERGKPEWIGWGNVEKLVKK